MSRKEFREALYAGCVGALEYDSNGLQVAKKKYNDSLDLGKFVDTFDDMTDKPPVPENQDVFVRVIFNNTLATCLLINIESA